MIVNNNKVCFHSFNNNCYKVTMLEKKIPDLKNIIYLLNYKHVVKVR